MARRLSHGIPRLYRNHRSVKGRRFRQEYQAIESRYGGPIPKDLRMDVASVADMYAEYRLQVDMVEQMELARQGKGRRPSVQQLRLLQRHKEFRRYSYEKSREKLEARLAASKPKQTLAELLSARPGEPL